MSYTLEYLSVVLKEDVPVLDGEVLRRIKSALEDKLVPSPDVFGKPLRRLLKGYRVLRAHDYRIVFRIEPRIVLVVAIRHRRDVYRILQKRIR